MKNNFFHQMIARVDWDVYMKTVRNCTTIQIYTLGSVLIPLPYLCVPRDFCLLDLQVVSTGETSLSPLFLLPIGSRMAQVFSG